MPVGVAVAVPVGVAVAVPVGVAVAVPVGVAVGVGDGVGVGVGVGVAVGPGLGDGVGGGGQSSAFEHGCENSDVLPSPSVTVAVMLGPVTTPGKLQLPSPSVVVVP